MKLDKYGSLDNKKHEEMINGFFCIKKEKKLQIKITNNNMWIKLKEKLQQVKYSQQMIDDRYLLYYVSLMIKPVLQKKSGYKAYRGISQVEKCESRRFLIT